MTSRFILSAESDARFREQSSTYKAVVSAIARSPAAGSSITIAGLEWDVPLDDRRPGGLASRMLQDDWLPMQEIARSRRWVRGDTMIDVGANIGTTAIPRTMLGDFEQVYAAEPDPGNYACLVRNVVENRLTGRVLPDRVAISDHTGVATLHRTHQIGGHWIDHSRRPGAENLVSVDCRTLDAWIDAMAIDMTRVSFIKVDTQGHEDRILDGAARTLSRDRIVWELEFSPRLLTRAGRDPAALCERIQRHFSRYLDLRRGSVRPRPTDRLALDLAYLGTVGRTTYTNLLLFK